MKLKIKCDLPWPQGFSVSGCTKRVSSTGLQNKKRCKHYEKSIIQLLLEFLSTNKNTSSIRAWVRAQRGSDRIKSTNPFLQAVASAEETLEDRNTKIWAHSSGMEDVWRCSQHPLLPAPSPSTHSPTLIELFVSPPVIVILKKKTQFSQH